MIRNIYGDIVVVAFPIGHHFLYYSLMVYCVWCKITAINLLVWKILVDNYFWRKDDAGTLAFYSPPILSTHNIYTQSNENNFFKKRKIRYSWSNHSIEHTEKRYLHAVPNSENSRFKSPPDIKARQHLKKSNSRRLFWGGGDHQSQEVRGDIPNLGNYKQHTIWVVRRMLLGVTVSSIVTNSASTTRKIYQGPVYIVHGVF